MKIIHLSDLHLIQPGQMLYGTSPLDRLQLAIDGILEAHADAEFCLLTGDLADAGGEFAYRSLAQALAQLPIPAYPLVGNHDDRAALAQCFPALATIADFLQSAIATAHGRFLLLDTLEPGVPWGNYCTRRREWLDAQLRETGDEPIWLAMHHPPFAVGIPSMDQYSLRDPEAFWSVIAPHRSRIRHLFFGHLHRPIGGSWHGIPFSCTAAPNHQIALDLATLRGDEVPGCGEPAGYSVILIDSERVVVHHQQLSGGETRFWL